MGTLSAAWFSLSVAPLDCHAFARLVASTGHVYAVIGPGWSSTMSVEPVRMVGLPSWSRLTLRPSASRKLAMRHSNPPSTAPSWSSRSRMTGRSKRENVRSRRVPDTSVGYSIPMSPPGVFCT